LAWQTAGIVNGRKSLGMGMMKVENRNLPLTGTKTFSMTTH
jgi:hypothetical protein